MQRLTKIKSMSIRKTMMTIITMRINDTDDNYVVSKDFYDDK
jgi:hypothetical protein